MHHGPSRQDFILRSPRRDQILQRLEIRDADVSPTPTRHPAAAPKPKIPPDSPPQRCPILYLPRNLCRIILLRRLPISHPPRPQTHLPEHNYTPDVGFRPVRPRGLPGLRLVHLPRAARAAPGDRVLRGAARAGDAPAARV